MTQYVFDASTENYIVNRPYFLISGVCVLILCRRGSNYRAELLMIWLAALAYLLPSFIVTPATGTRYGYFSNIVFGILLFILINKFKLRDVASRLPRCAC
jgi:hypothetical protein